jgi:hypothetical protein
MLLADIHTFVRVCALSEDFRGCDRLFEDGNKLLGSFPKHWQLCGPEHLGLSPQLSFQGVWVTG